MVIGKLMVPIQENLLVVRRVIKATQAIRVTRVIKATKVIRVTKVIKVTKVIRGYQRLLSTIILELKVQRLAIG